MQTQATSLVSFSAQTPPTGAGRSNSSSDKAFAACLSDKQQATNVNNKTVSRQPDKSDAATPEKEDAPQEDKQQSAEEATTASAQKNGTADQQQPVPTLQQPDASVDIALRMAVFTPVNGLVQIANANAAGKSNAGSVVNTQAVNANANSAMLNMNSALAMPQDGQLPQGLSEVLAQAGAVVVKTNGQQMTEGLTQQQGTVPITTKDPSMGLKMEAPLNSLTGQSQPTNAADDAVMQQPVVPALNQPPAETPMAAQQTTDVDADASGTTTMHPTLVATAQQVVQAPAAVMAEQATSVPQQQSVRTPNAETVKSDAPQTKDQTPLDSIKAVGASKEQAEAKLGQQMGKEQLPADAKTVETNQEKTTDVTPFNYSSVKSSVEVVTHSGAAVEKQNAVQADAILRQVADQVRLTRRPGTEEMIMHLKPEQLGDVTVKLMMESGRLTARFHADNPEVRIVLENSLQQLKQDLTSAGIKVHDVGVYSGLDNPLGQQGERGQAWAGMTGNGNSSRKTEAMSETLIQELEQQTISADSSDNGVDYRV